MKRLVFVLAVLVAGCHCAAEKQVVTDIEKTQTYMDAEYLRYIDHDPMLKPEEKDDRHKMIESRQRLLEKLKKSLE